MITIRIGMLLDKLFLYITYLETILALAVFTRSPAAYNALKSFKILQLPSRSTIQSYTGSFLHEPGASSSCIANQLATYMVYKEECLKNGKKQPKGDSYF